MDGCAPSDDLSGETDGRAMEIPALLTGSERVGYEYEYTLQPGRRPVGAPPRSTHRGTLVIYNGVRIGRHYSIHTSTISTQEVLRRY